MALQAVAQLKLLSLKLTSEHFDSYLSVICLRKRSVNSRFAHLPKLTLPCIAAEQHMLRKANTEQVRMVNKWRHVIKADAISGRGIDAGVTREEKPRTQGNQMR